VSADGVQPAPVEAEAEAPHLGFMRRATKDVLRFNVFALLRQAEAYAQDAPRISRSRRPEQNLADLAQAPSLGFPASTLASIAVQDGRAKVRGYYLGLTGPMGALPLHLSEIAFQEERFGRRRSFGAFLDLISGRMLQFFFRAWADSQPVSHADRPKEDRFAGYVAALSGAMEGVPEDAVWPARARLHYAALFASRRSAGAVEDALRHLLGASVRVTPFEPRWREIEAGDRSRLGAAGGFAQLGGDAVLGAHIYTVADAFKVTVRAASLADYASLLPDGRKFAMAAEALEAFAPSHLEWELELEIACEDVRPAQLDGSAALGWTGWLGATPRRRGPYRADARLRRNTARPMRQERGNAHG
jgi:type VI secretion system ImpH/TssG family protein